MPREGKLHILKYLKDEYNLNITKDFGLILEDLVAEIWNIQRSNILNCLQIKKLQEYFKSNDSIENWGIVAALQINDIQEYFFARWLTRNIKIAYEKNNTEAFYDFFLQSCNKKIIGETCISCIIDNFANNDCSKYKEYLKSIFNFFLEKKVFDEIKNKELLYVFINLWNVTKAFNHNIDPIYDANKSYYVDLLKHIATINESMEYNHLFSLDFSYMNFSNLDLSKTYLYNVNFTHCNFSSANLDSVSWSGSDLSYSNFDFAIMECAHLKDCNCEYASFHHAHLLSSVVSGADFSYADLSNANFMECDADRIVVKGMKIDDKTAFNETDLRYVKWEDIDISGLSISENQVSHFWEVVNYTRNTILYDAKFRKLDNIEIQDVIFKELKASAKSYLKKTKLSTVVKDIFISYASEEKKQYAFPIYKAIRKECGDHEKFSVWIDDENLTVGSQLRNTVESIISYCKLAIIFYSDNYAHKGWTRYEIYRILQEYQKRNIQIITIQISTDNLKLDSYQQICKKIPKENQYIISNVDSIQEEIVYQIKALL